MHNARDMATPKPGEIRCPTCHRSTPPAAFCTQCGSAIPPDARIRPRGMDRDELQERIRARRTGGDPYRRGGAVDEERAGYERYEPDPIDARARRGRAASERRHDLFEETGTAAGGAAAGAAGAGATGDLTRDRDDWDRAPTRPEAAPPPPAVAAAPPPAEAQIEEEPAYVDNFDDEAYEDEPYPYEYDEWDDARDRRSGTGAWAIVGFLALGVLALLGGALLAGVFSGDPNTGAVPSPSTSATVAASLDASPSASAAASGDASAAPSGSPAASGDPVVFPDGFRAEAQPCIPGSVTLDGCNSNGAVNAGQVEVWIGFQNGTGSDVIGATLVSPDGSTVDGSIDLSDIGCTQACTGYTYFPFSGLEPGTYEVRITRNGEPAATTTFEVN
jgi:hypothetical protein